MDSEIKFKGNLENIQKTMIAYSQSTGVLTRLINEKGREIFLCSPNGDAQKFCEFFPSGIEDPEVCARAHLYGSYQARRFGDSYIFFCPAGLTHWAFPLILNNEFIGAVVAGPVLMRRSHDFIREQILQKYDCSSRLCDRLNDLLAKIEVIAPDRVRHLSDLLFIVGSKLIDDELEQVKKQREIYEQQARLSEKLQSIKFQAASQDGEPDGQGDMHISRYYPLEKEKELVKKVKIGDKIGAREILNELLGHVLFKSGGKIEVIKARVLELMVVLSRAAVEGGANLEMIFGLNLNYLQKLSNFNSVDEISYWLIRILERFTESVFHLGDVENYDLIFKAINFIRENYMENIKLEDVAEAVHLSPSYFSRTFKKEAGMTFTEFLNRVRVEESKTYMADLSLSLSEIAQMVGFQDQSYFSRIFKKFEDTPPGKFRRTLWGNN